MATCRACLCTNEDLVEVDTTFLSNYNSLTNLQVEPFDGLPECFCHTCIKAVNFFIDFKAKCISSESTLREKGAADLERNVETEAEIEEIKNEDMEEISERFDYELVDIDRVMKTEVKKENDTGRIDSKTNEDKESCNIKAVKRRKRRGKGYTKIKRPLLRVTTNKEKQPYKICEQHYCGLCDESFDVLDLLNEHLDTHRTDIKCSICSTEFENWPKLLVHRVTHSGKKLCHLCSKRFHNITNMEKHYLTIHYEEKIAEMGCLHCPKKFTCPQKFSIHAETHNIGCHMCSEIFKNRHQLNIHLRTHEPKKRYQCDMCEYTAVHAKVLEIHKKRKHKKFSCKICERKFADHNRLKKHVCKDKSKLCPICGQHIYESFNRHLKSHTDAKPFKCDRCPATFKHSISLKTHLDRHDGNRTHECDYCERKFFASSTLNKHRRVHTGEKPYACQKCGKRFTGNSNLRLHMQTHGIMLISKRAKPGLPAPPVATVPDPSVQATSKEDS